MRNMHLRIYKNVGFGIMVALLALVATIAILTHANRNLSNANQIVWFAVEHHTSIMVVLIVLSVSVGFAGSQLFYRYGMQKKKDSRGILETVLLFLSSEEKKIVHFLMEQKGSTTQAEISRLSGLSRVKAHRSLQKMQEKNLIEIVPHGKQRKVHLRENIYFTLKDDENLR